MRATLLFLFTLLSLTRAEAPVAPQANITGRCQCGKITYEVTGKISEYSPCDCRDCQQATGAFKVTYAVVKGDGIQITSGQPMTYTPATGVKCSKHGTWRFCSDCGTKIFWVANKGRQTDILAGTLDDPKPAEAKNK